MKRVMIVGQPGSGESTLARTLGEVTGLRVVHMDKIHWMSGWVQRDDEGRWALVNEAHAREEWIFEGGFSRSWDVRATRADTLIWIDVGVWKRLLRVTWRFIKYFGQARPDLPEGCKEGNWRELITFYQWIWTTRIHPRGSRSGRNPAHPLGHVGTDVDPRRASGRVSYPDYAFGEARPCGF